jgi:alkylation response protein AidB-like acyl-CoA dehydrogenase
MQWLDEEQEIARQTVLRISRETLAPAARDLDREMAFPRTGLSVLSEAGFLGCTAPRQYGGLESSAIVRTVILEQIAQGCASTALVCLTHWVCHTCAVHVCDRVHQAEDDASACQRRGACCLCGT